MKDKLSISESSSEITSSLPLPSMKQTKVDDIPTRHDVSPQVNTISCSLDSLIQSLCYVSKPPKVSDICEIDNGVINAVNLEFYREYNKSPDSI